jgi:predicted secreted hydrolase
MLRCLRIGSLLCWMLFGASSTAAPAAGQHGFAPVVPGVALSFPRDFGSHDEFRTEWWYLTGWLTTPDDKPLGFQITFFRTRAAGADANPSAFATRQILIAHCAISDPAHGRLWQDQRVRREGLGLAQARSADTQVWIDDWRLERSAERYQASVAADGFALHLTLAVTQPPMPNGERGYSRKGPAGAAASYYYSQPQLKVSGTATRAGRSEPVTGVAWLDHEWSSEYLDPSADGWDWIGLNLNDGGALMAFRIRDHHGRLYWSAGTYRDATGQTQTISAAELEFAPRRLWRSARSGVSYPVSWQVRAAGRDFLLEPLMDDQENDTRLSTGAIYWEGAVRVSEHGQNVGRGYLELTGYEQPLTLR